MTTPTTSKTVIKTETPLIWVSLANHNKWLPTQTQHNKTWIINNRNKAVNIFRVNLNRPFIHRKEVWIKVTSEEKTDFKDIVIKQTKKHGGY